MTSGYHTRVDAFRVALLAATLRAAGGCRTEAAALLGLTRTYFQRLLVQHGIQEPVAKIGSRCLTATHTHGRTP